MKLLLWCNISLHCFLQPVVIKRSRSVVSWREGGGAVTETVKDTGVVFDCWTLYLSVAIHLPLPGLPGATGQPTPPAKSWEGGRDNGTSRSLSRLRDTTGASLTNCPCLAAWESLDCGNCIFPSNCICHTWGLLLWSQVWGPFSAMC